MANKKVSQLTSKPSVLTTDLFPIADPSTGQLYKTTISDLGTAIGSGVSSVNGLVGAVVLDTDDIQELVSPTNKWFTDTRARAALSASSPLTYNSGTGVFGIQVANGSQNGYLSSADWTTFNSKQAALSGTGFVKISGTTISYDNTSYLPLTGGTLTGNLNGTNITISNSLIAKGGTFNGGALSGGVVTIDGLGSDLLMNRADTSNGASITLLTNAVEKWNIGLRSAGTTDNFFIYNSNLTANALTINSVTSAATFASSVTASALYVTGMTAGSGAIYHTGSRLTFANYNASGTLHFEVNGGTGALTINADTSASFVSTLNATGATLTGALSGTSATFTNSLHLDRTGVTAATPLRFTTAGSNDWFIGQSPLGTSTSDLFFYSYGTSSSVFTLSKSTGAATFSSSVTAGGSIASGVGLSVANGTNARKFELGYSTGAGYNFFQVYDGTSFQPLMINNTMYFNSSGNVGIGTSVPVSIGGYTALTLNNATTGGILTFQQNGTNKASIYNDGSSNLYLGVNSGATIFENNGTERMRITSVGAVQIGTRSDATESTANLALNNTNYGGFHFLDGTAYYIGQNSNFRSLRMYSGGSTGTGVNLAAGATSWGTYSDERMKTDLMPIENATEKVSQLRSVIGRYKTDEQSKKRSFLIAQDVKEVLPEAISEDLQTGMLEIRYTEVIPLLVASIKELKAELDALKA